MTSSADLMIIFTIFDKAYKEACVKCLSCVEMFSLVPCCLLVCKQDYIKTDFHKSRTEKRSQPRTDPINLGCGSGIFLSHFL